MRQGPNAAALHDWLLEHKPELLARLIAMPYYDEFMQKMNEVTGLSVRGTDLIEEGSRLYLEALKRQS